MGKPVALGINTATNQCICIYSKATFEQLKEDFDLYNKSYSATNWEGRDDLTRTLELRHIGLTDESFDREVTVVGADPDHGHVYRWRFTFDKVVKVKSL